MRKLISYAFVLLCVQFSLLAHADIDSGVSWLKEQQRPDGAFQLSSNPLAAEWQSATVAAGALYYIEGKGSAEATQALDYLGVVDIPDTTQSLSYRILLAAQKGRDVNELINTLLIHQNNDGGFGDQKSYASSAYDTALALKALKAVRFSDASILQRAVAYVAGVQQADGGFPVYFKTYSKTYVTAEVLEALHLYRFSLDVNSVLEKAKSFLFSKRKADQSWGAEWESADIILSLLPNITSVEPYQSLIDSIKSVQNSNGSWDNDIYATSIILKLLKALEQKGNTTGPVVDPNKSGVTGRIIDGRTGAGIVGGDVFLYQASTIVAATKTKLDGAYLFVDIEPGDYSLHPNIEGYNTAGVRVDFNVAAAQTAALPEIELLQASNIALLSGAAKAKDTGRAVQNAKISLTQNTNTEAALTGVSGEFHLSVEAGVYEVTIEAAGYHNQSLTINLAAGVNTQYFPELVLDTQPKPEDQKVSVKGQVKNKETLFSLENVSVVVKGTSTTVQTDKDGLFEIKELASGSIELELTHPEYLGSTVTILAPSGAEIDLGFLVLVEKTGSTTSSIFGVVTDNTSGEGLSGVQVSVSNPQNNFSAITQGDGSYQIIVPAANYDLTIEKIGYHAVQVNVDVPSATNVNFSPVLVEASQPNPGNEKVTLKGTVKNSDTQQGVEGVSVVIEGASISTSTASDGSFELNNVSQGEMSLLLSKDGFDTSHYKALVSGVGVINAGELLISETKVLSKSISGVIKDSENGTPISGAVLTIPALNKRAVANALGEYAVSGLDYDEFDVVVTAAGFLDRRGTIKLGGNSVTNVNIELNRINSSGIEITEILLPLGSRFEAYGEAEVSAIIQNNGTEEKQLRMYLKIANSQGEIIDEFPHVRVPLGGSEQDAWHAVVAGDAIEAEVEWYFTDATPGQYTVIVQAYDGENRQLLAERGAVVEILSTERVGGGVQFDPPITQLASNQPVSIKANLTNSGNIPLRAGEITANVTLVKKAHSARPPQFNTKHLYDIPFADLYESPRQFQIDHDGTGYFASGFEIYKEIDGGHEAYINMKDFHFFPYKIEDFDFTEDGKLYVLQRLYLTVFDKDGSVLIDAQRLPMPLLNIEAGNNGDFFVSNGFEVHKGNIYSNDFIKIVGKGIGKASDVVVLDDGRMFIADESTREIFLYKNEALSSFVELPDSPIDIIAYNNKLYVLLRGGAVYEVNYESENKEVKLYSQGVVGANSIVSDEQGGLYVSNSIEKSLYKVDEATVTKIRDWLISRPNQIDFSDSGETVYLDNNNTIIRENSTGGRSAWVSIPGRSTKLTFNRSNGSIYVGGYGKIDKVSSDGNIDSIKSSLVVNQYVNDLKAAENGDVYAVYGSQNKIIKFDVNGQESLVSDSKLNNLSGITTDGQNLYVLERTGSSDILKITPEKEVSVVVQDIGYIGDELIYMEGGFLLVNDESGKRLLKVEISTGNVDVLGSTGAIRPNNIAVSPAGDIFFAQDYQKVIYQLTDAQEVIEYRTVDSNINGNFLVTESGAVWYQYAGTVYYDEGNGNTFNYNARGNRIVSGNDQEVVVVASRQLSRINRNSGLFEEIWKTNTGISGHNYATYLDGKYWLLAAGKNILASYDVSSQKLVVAQSAHNPQGIIPGNNSHLVITVNSLIRVKEGYGLHELIDYGSSYRGARYLDAENILLYTSSKVLKFNLSTNEKIDLITEGNIEDVNVREGIIYVLSNTNQHITKYDVDGNLLEREYSFGSPSALAYADGKVIVHDYSSRRTIEFDPATQEQMLIDDNASYHDIEFHEGDLYVKESGGIYRINLNTNEKEKIFTKSLGLGRIAISKSGEFLLAHGNLNKIDESGNVEMLSSGVGRISNMKLNNEDIYYSDFSKKTLSKILPTGEIKLIDFHDDYKASLMEFSSDGRLLVSGGLYLYFYENDKKIEHYRTSYVVNNAIGFYPQADEKIKFFIRNNYQNVNLVEVEIVEQEGDANEGSVVYSYSNQAGEMPVGNKPYLFGFGEWVPKHAGVYRVELSSSTGNVDASNILHVGATAESNFSLSAQEALIGDQNLSSVIDITGLDSTQVTKVESESIVLAAETGALGRAIASDSLGNVYAAHYTHIVKVTPDGSSMIFAKDLGTLKNGMSVDSKDNVYAITSTSLLKISPSGESQSIVDLTGLAAVSVDADDNVYIVAREALYHVHDGGVLNKIAQLPGYGASLTIDAYGNFYVLLHRTITTEPDEKGRYFNVIVKIDKSGNVGDYFSKARYEYEGVNVIADCSNNLMFAPVIMPPFIENFREEDRIIQLVGDTGETRLILDGGPVDRALRDIDVLYYDHKNQRLLAWTDINNGKVFSFPVLCGGLDINANIVTRSDVDLSGADPAPTTVIDNGDGTKHYVWSMEDVGASGAKLELNWLFRDLMSGETRDVVSEAYLEYTNSFAPDQIVRVPMDIPFVKTRPPQELSVSTDKQNYYSDEDVIISFEVNNISNLPFNGTVDLFVVDENDIEVAKLDSVSINDVTQGTPVTETSRWNTELFRAAAYKVKAVLLSEQGIEVVRDISDFNIVSVGAGDPTANLSVLVDKLAYNAWDNVQLTARLRNLMSNSVLPRSVSTLTVKQPDGSVIYTASASSNELISKSFKDMFFTIPLVDAMGGTYTAEVVSRNQSTNAELISGAADFNVERSIFAGLVGEVTVQPNVVYQGQTTQCQFVTRNTSGQGFDSTELRYQVVSLDPEHVITEQNETVQILSQSTRNQDVAVDAASFAKGRFACLLKTVVGGQEQNLAAAIFEVREPARIQVSPSVLSIAEQGGVSNVAVSLSARPDNDVTVQLSNNYTDEVSLDKTELVFTSANWNQEQVVKVTAVDDLIDRNDTALLSLSINKAISDSAYANTPDVETSISIIDNDQAGFTLDQSSVTIAEPSTNALVNVVLNSQPVGQVTIAFASSSVADAIVTPASISFDTSNWNQAKSISIAAIDDFVDRNDVARITASIAQAGTDQPYKVVAPQSVAVTILDDDVAGLNISKQNLVLAENAGTDTFSVALDTQPTTNVVISLANTPSGELTTNTEQLTFTPANWNVAQTVTATAVNDDFDREDSAQLIISVSQNTQDPVYTSLVDQYLNVQIQDDDKASLNVDTSPITLEEASGTHTFAISLGARPTGALTVVVTSSDTEEVAVDKAQFTFDENNWNQVQNITLTAVDDQIDRNDSAKVTVSLVNSADPAFSHIEARSIDVSINDDDVAAWVVAPSAVSVDENAGAAIATIKLATQPTADVVVAVDSSDTQEATASPAQLTFTAANWQQEQTITITGVDDSVARNDQAVISVKAADVTVDQPYKALNAATIDVTLINDDEPGYELSADSFILAEQGGTADLSVRLTSQPEADVVFSVTKSNDEVSLSIERLVFNGANWDQNQTIAITAIDDALDRDDRSDVTIAIHGDNQDQAYQNLASKTVALTITDDDAASFIVSEQNLTIDEESGTGEFTVVLGSEPEGAVSISVVSGDTAEATVAPNSLTFNGQNWNTPQTVMVAAVDDRIDRNDSVDLEVKVSSAPQDQPYQNLGSQTLSVTLTDNDESSISIEPSELTISENGGTGEVIIRLSSQPADQVTLTLASSDTAESSVEPAQLQFTADNWDIGLTATVTGVDDNELENHSATISVEATSGDGSYTQLSAQSVPVTLVNDDILRVEGSVTVATNPIQLGNAQVCDFTVSNSGSVNQPNLVIWKTLLKSDGSEVRSTRQTLNLNAGSSTTIAESFGTNGLDEGHYRCALSADLQSQRELLAEASFTLETPQVQLEAELDLVNQGRVLVLMDEGQPTCEAVSSVTLEGEFHKPVHDWAKVYAKVYGHGHGRHFDLLDYELNKPAMFTDTVNNNGYYGDVDISIVDLSQQHIRMKIDAEDVFQQSLKFYSYYQWKHRLHHINTGTVHFECGKIPQVGDKWGQFTVTAVETRELLISEEEESHCPTQYGGHYNGYGHGHYHHRGRGHHGHHDEQEDEAETPAVESQRAYVETLLKQSGISHTIVDSVDAFHRELRSGLYNQYLVSAARLEVGSTLAKELREAVHRGEGLIMASGSDLEPEALFDTLGLEYPRWKGGWHKGWHKESDWHWGYGWKSKWKYGWHYRSGHKHKHIVRTRSTGSGVQFSQSAIADQGQADFGLEREIPDISTNGAQTVGTLMNAQPAFEYHGEMPERDYPVVSMHEYGEGQAIYIGFDLLAEATEGQGKPSGTVYQNLILNSLGYAIPNQINTRAGAAVPLQLDLRNLGKAITGNSQFTFSEGMEVIDPSTAVENNAGVNWSFDLEEQANSHITLWLKPEYQQGQAWTQAAIQVDSNGQSVEHDILRRDITETVNAGESIEAICDDISAQHDADGYSWKALSYLHKAHRKMEYGDFDKAIKYLLETANALRKSQSAASPAIRKDVDWLIWSLGPQAQAKGNNHHGHHHGHQGHGHGHHQGHGYGHRDDDDDDDRHGSQSSWWW